MGNNTLSRRDFLKRTGQAVLFGTAAVCFESLTSCATFPKATIEDVDQINWDSNPVLPIPKNGSIYIGTNDTGTWVMGQDEVADVFLRKYGKLPTFLAPGVGHYGAYNRHFPSEDVEAAHRMGAIPMIRYIVEPDMGWVYVGVSKGYREINSGHKDNDIRIFGAEAAKLEKPIIVCPFQQVNDTHSGFYHWGGPSVAGPFKEAYVRIHHIWKQEGALDKVVIGVKLKVGRWQHWQFPDPLRYIPPKETVDIIGWCANNHCQPHMSTPSKSFEALLKRDYSRVVKKYPDIPQFIWELGCHEACNQTAWYDDALTKIEEKYHWIKAVNLDENADGRGSWIVDPIPNEESAKVIKRHFANPRYIANILPSNGLLNG